MSFYCYDSHSNEVKITNKSTYTPSTAEIPFYCPCCNCKMHFVSQASNKKSAHFSGNHSNGCDLYFSADADRCYEYHFENDTFEKLLNELKSSGFKTNTSSKRTTPISNVPKPKNIYAKSISTLRQLVKVLAASAPSDEIYPGTYIKDLYCGTSTAYLYKTYISGIHVVYCEFNGFDKSTETAFFKYPSVSNSQILVIMKFSTPSLFNDFLDMYRYDVHKKFIIFSEFINNHCNIDSLAQLFKV